MSEFSIFLLVLCVVTIIVILTIYNLVSDLFFKILSRLDELQKRKKEEDLDL